MKILITNILIVGLLLLLSNLKIQAQNSFDLSDTTTAKLENKYNDRINELNKQVTELSNNLADTKEKYYDKQLSLLNYIVGITGLVLILLAIFGYKNISDRVNEQKTESISSMEKEEKSRKEIKTDLIKAIDDLKNDFRDFRQEQKEKFEEFKNSSDEKIDKGLNDNIQLVIQNVMKSEFEKTLNDLTEMVASIETRLSSIEAIENLSTESNISTLNSSNAPILIEPEKNAFDD